MDETCSFSPHKPDHPERGCAESSRGFACHRKSSPAHVDKRRKARQSAKWPLLGVSIGGKMSPLRLTDGKTSPLSLAPLDSSPKERAKNAAEEPLPPLLGEVATPKALTERLDKAAASSEAEPLDPETGSIRFPDRGTSPAPGKRRKPTLFAAIKGSFAETKKMWQNRYKNIAKFITRITKVWGQLLYKVQKNGTKSAEKRRKSQKVSIWTLAI